MTSTSHFQETFLTLEANNETKVTLEANRYFAYQSAYSLILLLHFCIVITLILTLIEYTNIVVASPFHQCILSLCCTR